MNRPKGFPVVPEHINRFLIDEWARPTVELVTFKVGKHPNQPAMIPRHASNHLNAPLIMHRLYLVVIVPTDKGFTVH